MDDFENPFHGGEKKKRKKLNVEAEKFSIHFLNKNLSFEIFLVSSFPAFIYKGTLGKSRVTYLYFFDKISPFRRQVWNLKNFLN